jgi:hypothetical protein
MRSGMKTMLALGLTASVLLGAVPAAMTPASAYVRHYRYGHVHHYYRHYGYYHHRHYGAAPFVGAVGALIGGIAAGAAANHYYDYGPYPYYGGPYYGPAPYYGPYGYAW